MQNLNILALKCYSIAIRRDKIKQKGCFRECMLSIKEEVEEFEQARPDKQSEHVFCLLEQEEELADIVIACLSAAANLGINIQKAVEKKIEYNGERPD